MLSDCTDFLPHTKKPVRLIGDFKIDLVSDRLCAGLCVSVMDWQSVRVILEGVTLYLIIIHSHLSLRPIRGTQVPSHLFILQEVYRVTKSSIIRFIYSQLFSCLSKQ